MEVIINVYVKNSSIGHHEPKRGKVIGERTITIKKFRKPAREVKEYAVEFKDGSIHWRTPEEITPIKER